MRKLLMLLLLLAVAGCGEVSRPGQDGAARSTPTQAVAPTEPAFAARVTSTPARHASSSSQPTIGPSAGFRTWDEPPAMAIDLSKAYTATIQTEKGTIVIRLLPEQAPQTVNNFVFLARQGFYDGSTFHRVLPGFVAQGGDPTGTGAGGPGYTIPDELATPMIFDRAGLVAMAKTPLPDSAGSQFFITLGPAPNLNNQYTIFGEVVEGMNVVEQLTPRDPDLDSQAPPGDIILTVSIEEQ